MIIEQNKTILEEAMRLNVINRTNNNLIFLS